jgi:phosphatidyl-myo-inositol alpha-mannosyltransferase
MRIAIVSPYDLDVVGGVQSHVLALAEALRAAGDQVHVLGPGRSMPGRSGLGRSLAVPANGSRAPLAADPRAVARLRLNLRRLAPDVVHVHEPLVPPVGLAAALTRVAPTVLTFHAYAEGGWLPTLYRAVRRPARRIVDRAAALMAVSPAAARFHAGALGIDVDRLQVVPNGVDVARFASQAAIPTARSRAASRTTSRGEDGGRRRLVFIGRLEHRKGPDVALEAFLRLAGERDDVELTIVGEGPLRGRLEARLRSAAPEHAARVQLAGMATAAALPGLLAGSEVALLPSRGGESFGIVLLEAMAAGVAIVASDLEGYRAVARQDREAVLVPVDDVAALARAVGRLLDDEPLRARLVTAGSLRAAEHDWSAVAAHTREVYVQAVHDGRRVA